MHYHCSYQFSQFWSFAYRCRGFSGCQHHGSSADEKCVIKVIFFLQLCHAMIVCNFTFEVCKCIKLVTMARRPQVVGHTSSQISLKKSLGFVWARKMKWTVLWLEQIFCLRWDPNTTFIYWYVQFGAFVKSCHILRRMCCL